jgi:fucose permease
VIFTSVLFLSGAGGAAVPVLTGVLLDAVGDAAALLALGAAMALVAALSTANRSLRGEPT